MFDYPEFCISEKDKAAYDIAVAGGYQEWVRLRVDLRAIEAGCYFSLPHALHVKRFFETLLNIAPNKPFILLPWQWYDVIAPLFGWRAKNGKRRYRQCWIEIAKKNGKSKLISGLALYLLMEKYGAEVYNAASDRSGAEQVFKESAKMVINSPMLARRLQVINSTKRILRKGKSGVPIAFMRSLSKDSFNSQGVVAHGMLLDEVHIFRDREAFGSLRYATISQVADDQSDTSLLIMITTAGADRKSLGWEEHDRARKLIEGIVDYIDFHAVIYTIKEEDDIYDENVWYKANPSLGLTIDIDEFRQAAQKARDSKAEEIVFRRYRCNQWVAGQINCWLSMRAWFNCKPRLTIEQLKGRECWAGFDLSSVSDLTCLSLIFPDEEGGYHVLPFIWCPEDTVVERTQRENVPYQQWKELGLIETTPGDGIDYDFIRERIKEIGLDFKIREIALDKGWQGQPMLNDLIADGHKVVPFEQSMQAMSPPSKQFELLVRKGLIRHASHPIMQWCAGNCVAFVDTNQNVKPDKKKSTDKIDPIVATIMALGRALGSEGSRSIYNTPARAKGILFV